MSVKDNNIQELLDKAKDALDKSDLEQAHRMYGQAEKALGEAADDDAQDVLSQKAGIQNALAEIAWRTSKYDEALKRAEIARTINEEIGNKAGIAISLRAIGIVYSQLSNYAKALEFFHKARSIDEEIGNKAGVAATLANIGTQSKRLSDYAQALEYSQKALHINQEIGSKVGIANNLGNIGNVYFHLSDFAKALEYYQKAITICEEIGDKAGVARNLGNIANVYCILSDFAEAIEFYQKAITICEEIDNKASVAKNLGNMGIVYFGLSNYTKALEFHQKALTICEEIGDKAGEEVSLGNIGSVYSKLSDYTKALEFFQKAITIDEEIGDKSGLAQDLGNMGEMLMKLSPPEYKASEEKLMEALMLNRSLGTRSQEAEDLKKLSELYRLQERWKEADKYFRQYHEISAEIFNLEAKKQADNFAIQREIQEKEKQQAVEHAAKEAKHQATESLLQRVLPSQIADRLLQGEEQIADYHASTSILFADIQGFTALTADMPPYMLLQLLHKIFTRFDAIVKEAGCTKIKTIGDGYLIVAGAPEQCDDHAERIVGVAQEMIKPIELPTEAAAFLPDDAELKIRVGIHFGPVVAGVVGQDAFGYDIYSDAVNIASRMESNGAAGKVHVSADFMRHLLSRFAMTKNTNHGISFEKRGEIEVKGKGMMKTFFLCD